VLLLLWLLSAMITLLIMMVSSSPLRRFWYVKRVALTVTEVVGDLLAVTAIFADLLLEWLGFAPILLEQLLLCDKQRTLTRLQNLVAFVSLQV
jgi:hypothetical protein